jgi:type I restriction enzyme S subunit
MRIVEFGSLFQFIRNGMSVKQDKSGEGLPITRIETIADATIDETRVGYAGVNEIDGQRWLLEPGDILFSHINSVEHVGKCAIYRGVPEKLVHGMNLLCMRCDQTKLLPDFAKYLIRSPEFRSRLQNFINKAVNQASVSIGNLKPIPVGIPPIPEQRRIAAILDQADALRAKRREALAQLDTLAQSIFIEMFGDPASNQKSWPLGVIRDILESASYGTSEKSNTEGEFPVLRMNNITRSGELDLQNLKYMDLPLKDHERYLVKAGDVLFNRTNSAELVGKTTVIPELTPKLAYAGYLVRLRVNSKNHPVYLTRFLNTAYAKRMLRGMCKSIIGMANINATEIQAMQIAIPPRQLQQTFASRIHAIETLKGTHHTALAQLDTLFASLQHRAFRGEL